METKHCNGCDRTLPIDEFNWKCKSKNTRYHCCKVCWNAQNKKRYQDNKQYYIDKAEVRKQKTRAWLAEHKAKIGCQKCAERHPACLHFHHRDPEHKSFEICDALLTRSLIIIKEEMQKCDVLCANCHAKLHFELRGQVWLMPGECDGSTQPCEG